MTRAVWVGQERVWVGRGLPGLIARTASGWTIHILSPHTVPEKFEARKKTKKCATIVVGLGLFVLLKFVKFTFSWSQTTSLQRWRI